MYTTLKKKVLIFLGLYKNVIPEECDEAYGLYVELIDQRTKKLYPIFQRPEKAKHWAEVAVELPEAYHEMTLAQFTEAIAPYKTNKPERQL